MIPLPAIALTVALGIAPSKPHSALPDPAVVQGVLVSRRVRSPLQLILEVVTDLPPDAVLDGWTKHFGEAGWTPRRRRATSDAAMVTFSQGARGDGSTLLVELNRVAPRRYTGSITLMPPPGTIPARRGSLPTP